MNRRGFLGALFKGAVAVAASPLLSWVPKPKYVTFQIDRFISADVLTDEEVRVRYIVPAAQAMAARIDAQLLAEYQADTAFMAGDQWIQRPDLWPSRTPPLGVRVAE